MGIINRTMDLSEQKEGLRLDLPNQINAQEAIVGLVERACTITDAKATLIGISGAPTAMLRVARFVAGSGGSTFNIGSTMALSAYGLSGYISMSLPATGTTTLNLQKGDLLTVIFGGGTGAASTYATVDVVVQNIQDIKTWF